jgi:hypothetical protein
MNLFRYALAFSLLILMVMFSSVAALAEVSESHPGITLTLSLGKNEVYRGETVPVTVTLRVSNATVRNIGYPRLIAPTGGKVVFAPTEQVSDPGDPGVILHRFTGQMSVAKPGLFSVGPARLDCEVMTTATGSTAFFGGREAEPVTLSTEPASITLLPLPAAGRPPLFSGAIGTFALSVKAVPAQIANGEPLTVTTTIRGIGSLVDADCPTLASPSLQSFPVQESRNVSNLICEQVVVPDGHTRFPPVTWNYFDPDRRRYVLLTGSIPSRVTTPLPATITKSVSPHSTPMRVPTIRKPMVGSMGMPVILALVVGILGVLAVFARKRTKAPVNVVMQNTISHLKILMQGAEAAVLNGDVDLFYNLAFEIIQSVDKNYTVTPDGIHSAHQLENAEYHRLIEIKHLTVACDTVRYGRIMPDVTALATDFTRLKKILPGIF